jgi:hypothetical protein
VEDLAALLDAAERRGEERVLRRSVKAIQDRAKTVRRWAGSARPERAERLREIAEWIDGDVDRIRHTFERARLARGKP